MYIGVNVQHECNSILCVILSTITRFSITVDIHDSTKKISRLFHCVRNKLYNWSFFILSCENDKGIHGDIVDMPITYISINNKYLYTSKKWFEGFSQENC